MDKSKVDIIVKATRDKFIAFCCLLGHQFVPSWHHRDVAAHLEKVESGEIKRLIIMLPPRHGKSTQATILFPTWYLGRHPDKEIITVSYSGELAVEFGEKSRDVMKDDRYSHIFDTKLKQDSESKQKWKTEKGGGYLSTGMGGSITGRGADLLIIDDPIKNQEEALSDTYRQKIWNYYTSTLYTRLEKDAAIILILTRWHQDDLAGRIIESMQSRGEKWEVVHYPAIAEHDEKFRKAGEPLWPEKYDLDALANIRDTIGVYDWSSLYQQNPIPSELQEFKSSYFKYFEEDDIATKNLDVYVMVDLAISQKLSADNTSIQVIGKESGSSNIYRLEEYTGRFDPLQVIEILFNLKTKYGYKLMKVGIEGVQYQKALSYFILQEMRRKGIYFDIVELKATGDKESRIRGLLPMYKAGVMFHRKGDKDLESELLAFPVGKHDDRIDALAYLTQMIDHKINAKGSTTYYPHLKKLIIKE